MMKTKKYQLRYIIPGEHYGAWSTTTADNSYNAVIDFMRRKGLVGRPFINFNDCYGLDNNTGLIEYREIDSN